jgi:hypothetical protein
MATLDQLSSALVKADAAGDVDAAKAFASEIKRMRSASPAEPSMPTTEASAPRQNVGAEVPAWAKENPRLYETAQTVRQYAGPVVEMGGAIAGGVVGSGLGPAGTVGGSALGYGMGKEATRLADLYLGNVKGETPTQTALRGAENIVEGGMLEAGGQIAAPYIAKGAKYISKGIGYGIDALSGQLVPIKAGNVARNALGGDVETIKNALAKATPGQTAAQATAEINSPVWQALNAYIQKQDPRFYGGVANAQNAQRINQLAALAGGGDQTAARALREESKNTLNQALIPQLNIELKAANTAGEMLPKLEGQANRFGEAATNKVEDVRRMVAAGERAADRANNTFPVPGMPRVPARYTYMGELATKADEVATQAANASLPFGEAARFAQAGANSLAAHGLAPLKSDAVVASLARVSKAPEFAGNRDLTTAINRVGKDIMEWTNSGGVIDAFALDSIRKNSVNSAIRELYPNAEATVQKELAAKVLGKIKPVIVDAVEKAGGTGYGQYLENYSKGMQAINQKKLSADALKMYESNPNEFIRLVEGNKPKEVEKIFGAGSYNIVKEMSDDAMKTLKNVAGELKTDIKVAEQAKAGRQALGLETPSLSEKIPGFVGVKTAVAKKVIQALEGKIDTKTIEYLTEGLKTGRSAQQLLAQVPASEKIKVLNAFATMSPRGAPEAAGKAAMYYQNSLAPEQPNQNALAR